MKCSTVVVVAFSASNLHQRRRALHLYMDNLHNRNKQMASRAYRHAGLDALTISGDLFAWSRVFLFTLLGKEIFEVLSTRRDTEKFQI